MCGVGWQERSHCRPLPPASGFSCRHETLERITTIPEQLQGGDLNYRVNIWQAGWQAFVQAPFFGSGAGTFVHAARLAPEDTAHNTLLSIGGGGRNRSRDTGGGNRGRVCAIGGGGARAGARWPWRRRFLAWLVISLVATVEVSRTHVAAAGIDFGRGANGGGKPWRAGALLPATDPEFGD